MSRQPTPANILADVLTADVATPEAPAPTTPPADEAVA